MTCLEGDGSSCSKTGNCSVVQLWARVRDSVSEALNSFTLADLAVPGAPITLKQK